MEIAVIVPCWNQGRLLRAALASIAAQTVQPSQIVVVDDGSTDETVEVASADPGVTLVKQRHRGIAAARNAGLASTDADLIAFLDADDLWPPTSLACRMAALSEESVDGCFGRVEEFGDSPCVGPVRAPTPSRLPGAILVTRHALHRVGLFDTSLSVGEAIDWVARFDAAGLRWGVVSEVVLRRRIHDANTSRGAATRRDLLKVARRAHAARRYAP